MASLPGVHCVYLDPSGQKSLRPPVKQTFMLDRARGAGAVCVLQESNNKDSTILLAEGIEDGLSLLAAGRARDDMGSAWRRWAEGAARVPPAAPR